MKEREAAIPPQGEVRIPDTLERLMRRSQSKGDGPDDRGSTGATAASQSSLPASTEWEAGRTRRWPPTARWRRSGD